MDSGGVTWGSDPRRGHDMGERTSWKEEPQQAGTRVSALPSPHWILTGFLSIPPGNGMFCSPQNPLQVSRWAEQRGSDRIRAAGLLAYGAKPLSLLAFQGEKPL